MNGRGWHVSYHLPTPGAALLAALSLGCHGSPTPIEEGPPMACHGVYEASRVEDQAVVGWGSEQRGAELRLLRAEEWRDAGGAELRSAVDYAYDRHGRLIFEGEDLDGDGQADLERDWTYDVSGRDLEYVVRASAQWDEFGTGIRLHQVHEWEDDGTREAITMDWGGDGAVDARIVTHWQEGRLIQRDQLRPDGEVFLSLTRTHLAPAPDPNHVDELDYGGDGVVEHRIERRFDDRGQLEVEVHELPSGRRETRTSWDDAGRPLSSWIRFEPTHPDAAPSVTHETWAYDARGLVEEHTWTRDHDDDGVLDDTLRRTWTWTCE